jgi:hypothetical protein
MLVVVELLALNSRPLNLAGSTFFVISHRNKNY